jgi:ABC-type transport system involved in cytochrome c biogenesis permease subunit
MSTELISPMLYIHPPLSIVGYIFIFLFTIFLFRKKNTDKQTRLLGLIAWTLTFAGLVTGMLWAQLSWGNYWSWDPKETLTLILFIVLSASILAYFEKHPKMAKWLSIASCALVIITGSSSFILTGLHSFLH